MSKVKVKLSFCPTGEGGGRDNSCGKGGSDKAVASLKKDKEDTAKLQGSTVLYKTGTKEGSNFVAVKGKTGFVGDVGSSTSMGEKTFSSEKEAKEVMGLLADSLKGQDPADDQDGEGGAAYDNWEELMSEHFPDQLG